MDALQQMNGNKFVNLWNIQEMIVVIHFFIPYSHSCFDSKSCHCARMRLLNTSSLVQ